MDFKSCFDQVSHLLPDALMDSTLKSNISRHVPIFPEFSVASIECHLDSSVPRVDVAIGYELELVRTNKSSLPLQPKSLFDVILNTESFSPAIRGVWFNYDFSQMENAPPWSYLVFNRLNLGLVFDLTLITRIMDLSGWGTSHDPAFLKSILTPLPPGAFIMGLALPGNRNADMYRLVIYGIHFPDVLPYLEAIPGIPHLGSVRNMFNGLESSISACGILMDIMNNQWIKKIGFELLNDRQDGTMKINQAIDHIGQHGLLDHTKWGGLKLFRPYESKHSNQETISLWLNHIKIVIDQESQWSVKSYFGVQSVIQ
jgi:hypothetical protein